VLIVLPPSETKASPPPGESLDLESLAFPTLTPQRKRVLTALVRLCRADEATAMTALGLGVRQAGEVAVNARLRTAPAAPAIEVYSGVLYEALDAGSLTATQRRRLDSMVAICSALFGLLRPQDRIPAYRLNPDAALPGLASLAQAWRPSVSLALEQASGLVWDLRSAAYVALGPPPNRTSTVTSRILLQRGGKRTVVSHHNKATKGRILRDLAATGGRPRTPTELADTLSRLGYRCELTTDTTGPCRLDVVVDAV